jgi:hypothetical protein
VEWLMAKKQIRFHIEGTTPHALPMARLAEYLTELSTLFGNKQHVHFLRVETGSAPCVIEVDQEYEERVFARVKRAELKRGPRDAVRANLSLRTMLKRDQLWAELKRENGDVVVGFPLVKEKEEETFGPYWQDGSLEGYVVRLGGIDETLPVHLVYEGRIYICNASRDIVRQLGPRIWGNPVRVHGRGKWYRNEQGIWEMLFFDIHSFEDLEASTLSEAIEHLRAIPDNDLLSMRDPFGEVQKLRSGE